jgi:hypothetical protein
MRAAARYLLILIILGITVSAVIHAEDSNEKKYITVIPGKEYKAGGLHRFFLGSHWRDLWATPIKVEVLDLDTFAGGLTPHKRGGGRQTISLRLKGKDGNTWKFRSVNKDPKLVLVKELRDTVVESVIKDQISTANPMAPLMLAPILNAVGIMQADPILVWMPDDERLGQFRQEFGGMLGTIEIHPEGRDEDSPGFAGAKRILGTYDLYERLEKQRDEKVDSAEFLKARLVDIFVGDWDRHSDQWRWAWYKVNNQKLWKPIPRDRDQAFAKFTGLFPRLAERLVMHLNGFRKYYNPIKKLTWSGRHIDRRYLTELDKATWDTITLSVKNSLTDQVIEEAVRRLPAEIYKKASKEIITKLKARRDKLHEISTDFYNRINDVIDIYASDKDDLVEVKRISSDKTEVILYKRGKKSGEKKGKPLYHKIVDNRLTAEIRIFMGGGDDRAVVTGTVGSSPRVRIVGGKGKDELIDSSKVKGFLKAETKTVFYDRGKKTIVQKGPGTKIVRAKPPKPWIKNSKYEDLQKNRDTEVYSIPMISFNSDDGFVVGAGALLFKYGFRVRPYKFLLSLNASYASKTSSHHIDFKGIFNTFIRGTSLHLQFLKTQLLFNDYYGFGNDTSYDSALEDAEYYETEEEFYISRASLHFNLNKKIKASLGAQYTASDVQLGNILLLKGTHHYRYGLDKFESLDVNASLQYDSRDKAANPYKGVFLQLEGSFTPKWLDNRYSYIKTGFDARVYVPLKLKDITFALRLGGSKVFGDYPFFSAAFLGGGGDLRGYNRKRFSGDAALFGQAELRAYLFRLKLLLRGRLGFHLFYDAGRVFKDGESSNTLHSSYGGGIWIAFANRALNTSFTFAKSEEKTAFYFALRMMY